jgi:hypothetical protein
VKQLNEIDSLSGEQGRCCLPSGVFVFIHSKSVSELRGNLLNTRTRKSVVQLRMSEESSSYCLDVNAISALCAVKSGRDDVHKLTEYSLITGAQRSWSEFPNTITMDIRKQYLNCNLKSFFTTERNKENCLRVLCQRTGNLMDLPFF